MIEKGTPKDWPVSSTGSKAIGIAGKALGWYDAYNSIQKARTNPTLGNVTKAAVKTTLATLETFMKVNPAVGVITTILDMTGATGWLFNW